MDDLNVLDDKYNTNITYSYNNINNKIIKKSVSYNSTIIKNDNIILSTSYNNMIENNDGIENITESFNKLLKTPKDLSEQIGISSNNNNWKIKEYQNNKLKNEYIDEYENHKFDNNIIMENITNFNNDKNITKLSIE